MDPLLLTVPEAATLLNIKRTKMFELITRGEIESVKVGAARKVPRDAVDAYIKRLRAQQSIPA
jgi:excisionase family DNA binding protein